MRNLLTVVIVAGVVGVGAFLWGPTQVPLT